jgi:hypothetical protein
MPTIESIYADTIENLPEDQNASPTPGRGTDVLIRASGVHTVGIVEQIRAHALLVVVMRRLAEGAAVSVEFGAQSRDGEVASCRRTGGGYEVCILFPNRNPAGQRAGERFPVVQEVAVSADNLESPQSAALVDLSENGIGLLTRAALSPQQIVTVQGASSVAFGMVRYTKKLPDGRVHAGIEIFHVMPQELEEERSSRRSVVNRLFA